MAVATNEPTSIQITPIETRTIQVAIIGNRPIILNRLAEKARQELLMPKGRKTTAEKASSMKHDPVSEYQASPYIIPDPQAPTYIGFPAAAFKKAMMSAALRVPGVRKTEIAQLLWVEGDLVPIFGTPELFMAITRSADMNKTPDVRTRAIIEYWATAISITYVTPILNETSVINLLAAAGKLSGVGDWRVEKGAGTFGQFSLTNETDEAFSQITSGSTRASQIDQMNNPIAYNDETNELFAWFQSESKLRGKGA